MSSTSKRQTPTTAAFLVGSMCGILLLVLADVLRFQSFSMPAILAAVAALVGMVLPLALWLRLLGSMYSPSDRFLAGGRLVFILLLLPPVVLLADDLARGAGVMRAGNGWLLRLGIPLAFGVTGLVLQSWLGRLMQGRRFRCAVVFLCAAAGARLVNESLFSGLYAGAHDFLFLVELLSVAMAFTFLFSRFEFHARVVRSAAGLGALALVGWMLFEPAESVRAIHGRDGFHTARLQRWRSGLRGPIDEDPGKLDQELLDQWQRWKTVAAAAEERFDAAVPGRRNFNLVWISIDTLRPDRMGCDPLAARAGAESLTPAMDELAGSSVYFSRAWAQYPSTHLSSASMFTGRYPTATPLYRAIEGTADAADQCLSFPQLADRNGMATAAAIAFTLDWMETPVFRQLLAPFELLNPDRPHPTSTRGDVIAHCAETALTQMADRRFFLWFHLFDPHHPYEIHEGLTQGDSATQRYDGEVKFADRQVKRILQRLEALDIADRTIVVLNSDHGEAFGEHDGFYHGSSLYEEQIRVPLMMRIPGVAPRQVDSVVENVDVYTTLQELLGLEHRSVTQGTSLLPLLLDGDTHDDYPDFAYAELPDDVKELSGASANLAMYVEGGWKVIRHLDQGYTELYHLDGETGETEDLAGKESSRRDHLLSRLRTVRQATADFGRSRSADENRAAQVLGAGELLDNEDPFVRQRALHMAGSSGLTELAPDLFAKVRDRDEYPELRLAALRLAGGWDSPTGETIARAIVRKDSPVMVWGALRWLVDQGASIEPPGNSADSGSLGREIAAARVASGDRGEVVLAEIRSRIVDPFAGTDSAKRNFLLLLRGAPEVALGLPDEVLLRLLGSPWSAEEWGRILDAAHGTDKSRWLKVALDLVQDRYLAPALREKILDGLGQVPESVGRALAMHLLSGWDPAFHERAKKKVKDLWGVLVCESLADAKTLDADIGDFRKSGEWARVLDTCVEAMASLSAGPRSHFRQLAFHAALALDNPEKAAGQADEMYLELASLPGEVRDTWWKFREDEIAALRGYDAAAGLLSEKAEIRVTGVRRAPGASASVSLDRQITLEVKLENTSKRTLLGGDWPRAGRLRVLWRRDGTGDDVYGTEVPLAGDLGVAGVSRQVMHVELPSTAGRWQGRIIVNQQDGARFHWVEDDRSVFSLDVVGGDSLPVVREWSPRDFADEWTADPGVEAPFVQADGFRYEAVMTEYGKGFTSPLVRLDGKPRKLVLQLSWFSPLKGADVLLKWVLRAKDGLSLGPATIPIEPSGGMKTIEVKLDAIPAGVYRLKLIPGNRQGFLALAGVAIR